MGLLAVIGPSRNDQGGPPAVCARSFSKMRFSAQKRRTSRSMAGKSGTFGTDRYIFIWDKWQKGSTTPEKPILSSARLPLAAGPLAGRATQKWRPPPLLENSRKSDRTSPLRFARIYKEWRGSPFLCVLVRSDSRESE